MFSITPRGTPSPIVFNVLFPLDLLSLHEGPPFKRWKSYVLLVPPFLIVAYRNGMRFSYRTRDGGEDVTGEGVIVTALAISRKGISCTTSSASSSKLSISQTTLLRISSAPCIGYSSFRSYSVITSRK